MRSPSLRGAVPPGAAEPLAAGRGARSEARLALPKPTAGEYYVRVRATDPDGFVGQWSSPQRFVVEEPRPWWLIGVLPLLLLIH